MDLFLTAFPNTPVFHLLLSLDRNIEFLPAKFDSCLEWNVLEEVAMEWLKL